MVIQLRSQETFAQQVQKVADLGYNRLTASCYTANYYDKLICATLNGGCSNREICKLIESQLYPFSEYDLQKATVLISDRIQEYFDVDEISGQEQLILLGHKKELAKYFLMYGTDVVGEEDKLDLIDALLSEFLNNLEEGEGNEE